MHRQRKKYLHFTIILCIIICLLSCAKKYSGKKAPKAVKGILDLQGWDFEKDGPVELDGEWEFHWKKFKEIWKLAPNSYQGNYYRYDDLQT